MGGSTTQDFSAGNMFATVAREQYNIGRNLARPMEQGIKATLNGATLPETMGMVEKSLDSAFDTQKQAMGLDMARRGVTPDAGMQEAIDRQFSLGRAGAEVGLKNAGRLAVRDREQQTLSGGVTRNVGAATLAGAK